MNNSSLHFRTLDINKEHQTDQYVSFTNLATLKNLNNLLSLPLTAVDN